MLLDIFLLFGITGTLSIFFCPNNMSLFHGRSKACIALFHVWSEVCFAPFLVQIKLAPHMHMQLHMQYFRF